MKQLVPDEVKDPLKCLQCANVNNLKSTVPNLLVTLRILVTIPVIVVATLDLEAAREKFADMKARKIFFYKFCFLCMINESCKMK